jgi:AAA domain-containing protein
MFRPPGNFIKHLTESGFPTSRGITKEEGIEAHWLDLTQLKLRVGHFTPFAVAPRLSGQNIVPAERIAPVLESIQTLLRRRSSDVRKREDANFAVLVVGGLLPEALWTRIRGESIVLIDKVMIDAIYNAKHFDGKARLLCSAFVRSLGHQTLSPYQVGRPAHGSTFFGREQILQTMLAARRGGGSYTIIGNRRIGKTSLLREIRHRLFLQDPDSRLASIYGGTVNSTEQALQEILVRLGSLAERDAADIASQKDLFPAYVHSIADRQRHTVAVFIDELDHILEFDARQGYELLELLRATFEHQACRIFLAGFRRTREAAQSTKTPLFNFTAPVPLTRFTREETVEMITRPLRLLGLDTVTSDLPTAVHRETGGQPELVQIFGTEIVSSAEFGSKLPATSEILSKVLEGKLFEEKVLSTFLSNTTPYEELLCYLLIDDWRRGRKPMHEFEFGYGVMEALLKSKHLQLRMGELRNIATNLEMAGVISPVEGAGVKKFTFSVPQLARYCISMDLEVCIDTALERVQTAPDHGTALWSDVPGEPLDGGYDD